MCTGNDVRVVSVHTGQTVRVLSAHTQAVTTVTSNPSNPLQVYTAGLDGFVRLWDYDDAVVLKVRGPVTAAPRVHTGSPRTLSNDCDCAREDR